MAKYDNYNLIQMPRIKERDQTFQKFNLKN